MDSLFIILYENIYLVVFFVFLAILYLKTASHKSKYEAKTSYQLFLMVMRFLCWGSMLVLCFLITFLLEWVVNWAKDLRLKALRNINRENAERESQGVIWTAERQNIHAEEKSLEQLVNEGAIDLKSEKARRENNEAETKKVFLLEDKRTFKQGETIILQ